MMVGAQIVSLDVTDDESVLSVGRGSYPTEFMHSSMQPSDHSQMKAMVRLIHSPKQAFDGFEEFILLSRLDFSINKFLD
jgi:hypothetical protein